LEPASSFERFSMLSYALRLNYAYKGRYLLTASTRWDGSSKFQKDNRWGMFPSAALAWRIAEEDFVKENASWIENLKLRASYGITGNNGVVGAYDTQSLASTLYYYGFGSTIAKGYGPNGVTNEGLTWEKTNEVDLGLDFSFLKGRISGTVDWYNRTSRDLLMEQKLKIEQGSSEGTMWANIGKVQNSGVEAMLRVVPIQTKDFYWDITASFAKNKNKILELQNGKEDMRADRWFIGQPIDVIYDLKMTGIATQNYVNEVITVNGQTGTRSEIYKWFEGCMTFEDLNQNGKIDDGDRQIIGQQLPKWTGTLSTSFVYKNWDFSVLANTRQGHKLVSPFMDEFTDYNDRGRTKLSMDFYIPQGAPVFNYDWDGNDPSTLTSNPATVATETKVGTYPYPYNEAARNFGGTTGWRTGNSSNTEFNPNGVVDASYVKIKNITLGYTFSKNLLSKFHIQSLRIYANVLNPFTFTDYRGFDPEWADASISEGTGGPSSITYQLGINLKF
jgi:TonB-linked SusC/RagA family outer membrane protein